MLNTSQFRFNLNVTQIPADDSYDKGVARRRLIRGMAVAAPLIVAGVMVVILALYL